MSQMNPVTLRAALQRLLPFPCRSRYSVVTMVPHPPGLLGRLAHRWACAGTAARTAVVCAALVGLVATAAAAVAARRRCAR